MFEIDEKLLAKIEYNQSNTSFILKVDYLIDCIWVIVMGIFKDTLITASNSNISRINMKNHKGEITQFFCFKLKYDFDLRDCEIGSMGADIIKEFKNIIGTNSNILYGNLLVNDVLIEKTNIRVIRDYYQKCTIIFSKFFDEKKRDGEDVIILEQLQANNSELKIAFEHKGRDKDSKPPRGSVRYNTIYNTIYNREITVR